MLRLLCGALLLLCATAGFSTTVYKTVDEKGVVSFSDIPPAGGLPTEVLQITPTNPQSPEAYLERFEAMRQTTDRMVSERREREKHRAELKEINARTVSLQPTEPSGLTPYADYFPVYSRRTRRHGYVPSRPGYRPKPEHPVIRPPLQKLQGVMGSSNAQLMRPLVSTRR